jgi:ParB family transcriptional regulator, chromosome partitioning protein
MSKLEKFKTIAHAALEPVNVDQPVPAPVREIDALRLNGTERLRGARSIPIDRIVSDPAQPRKHFPEKPLQELTESITAHGVLQPLTVTYDSVDDTYTIVTGERRYRAARRAGLKQLPCLIVSDLTDQDRFYRQLVENLQREDITPFEEADAFCALAEKFHLKHHQIARIVAKGRTYVTKTIGLARIPESVRRRCAQQGITSREHFTLLAQQKTEAAMLAFLEELGQHGGDVRTARSVARSKRPRQIKNRHFEFRYQTRGYSVRIRFAKHKASRREIASALTEALRSLDEP